MHAFNWKRIFEIGFFDLVKPSKLNHRFNGANRSVGKHFYYDFPKRHPDVSLRKPESTSLMGAFSFNRYQDEGFFNNLKDIGEKYNF